MLLGMMRRVLPLLQRLREALSLLRIFRVTLFCAQREERANRPASMEAVSS